MKVKRYIRISRLVCWAWSICLCNKWGFLQVRKFTGLNISKRKQDDLQNTQSVGNTLPKYYSTLPTQENAHNLPPFFSENRREYTEKGKCRITNKTPHELDIWVFTLLSNHFSFKSVPWIALMWLDVCWKQSKQIYANCIYLYLYPSFSLSLSLTHTHTHTPLWVIVW